MSSLIATEEETNFCRVAAIVIDLFAQVLRDFLTSKVQPADIAVKTNFPKKSLTAEEKSQLNNIPNDGNYESCDTSLLYKLIRNISQKCQPTGGWGKPVKHSCVEVADDILRIRDLRNRMLGHTKKANLNNHDYNVFLTEARSIVTRFDDCHRQSYPEYDGTGSYGNKLTIIEKKTMDKKLYKDYLNLLIKSQMQNAIAERLARSLSAFEREIQELRTEFELHIDMTRGNSMMEETSDEMGMEDAEGMEEKGESPGEAKEEDKQSQKQQQQQQQQVEEGLEGREARRASICSVASEDFQKYEWYYCDVLSRERVESQLDRTMDGNYLVRKSKPFYGKYEISMSYGGNFHHIQVFSDKHNKWYITSAMSFDTFEKLIQYYSEQAHGLPTNLKQSAQRIKNLATTSSEELGEYDWYFGEISRKIAVSYLDMKIDGHYLVRKSSPFSGSNVLSMTHGGNVCHFRIFDDGLNKWRVESKPIFNTLEKLITYYTKEGEYLPTKLMCPPTKYKNEDISISIQSLQKYDWYHGSISRELAESLLRYNGSYLVRKSTSEPGEYVLSLRASEHDVRHYKLHKDKDNRIIGGVLLDLNSITEFLADFQNPLDGYRPTTPTMPVRRK